MSERSKINPLEYTLDFQFEILKFFVSPNDFYKGSKYVDLIDADCFNKSEHALLLEELQKYKKRYGTIPKTQATFVEYLEESIPKSVKTGVKEIIYSEVRRMYEPFKSDVPIIVEKVLEYGQYVLTSQMIQKYAPRLRDGENVFKEMKTLMDKIVKLGDALDNGENEISKGAYLIKEYKEGKENYTPTQGMPTFLKALNRMTAAGGFYAPQLVVFMGAPKGFKTGTMLNIALGYVKDGYKVFYADFENSVRSIKTRSKQGLVGGTFDELVGSQKDDILKSIIGKVDKLGGELRMDYFQANRATLDDLDAKLVQLEQEDGFVPTHIFYDGLDLAKPIDKKVNDKRLSIQEVYHDAIRLQTKRQLVGFTPSQVGRKAISKAIIKMEDFSEDIGKAHNAHAAFAICRTDDEIHEGLARIVPVMQREGVRQELAVPCFVRIDEARMSIEEIDMEMEVKLNRRDNI